MEIYDKNGNLLADFEGLYHLSNINFELLNICLENVVFSHEVLDTIYFRNNLSESLFTHMLMKNVLFTECDLSNAHFFNSTFRDVRFENCDLSNTNFESCVDDGICYENCIVTENTKTINCSINPSLYKTAKPQTKKECPKCNNELKEVYSDWAKANIQKCLNCGWC